MNRRYLIPDGGRLRTARKQLGWSQTELAGIAGLSLGTIQRMEQSRPAEKSNLSIVEAVLGVRPKNWALSFLCDSVNREKAALLRTKTAESWPREAEPYYDFMRSLHRDAEGNHKGALGLCHMILEDDSSDQALTCAVLIHLATVYGHLKEPGEALKASEKALTAALILGEGTNLWWWSLYQKSIAQSQLNEHGLAMTALRELLEIASLDKRNGQRAAALHQIGVVKLRLGRLSDAADLFEQCIGIRGKNCQDFRLAYEYRRLGETYAKLKDRKRSTSFFNDALLIANRHHNARYVKEIRLAAEHNRIAL